MARKRIHSSFRPRYIADMGGYGSGRHNGRPTADESLFLDIAWMLSTGKAQVGLICSGTLGWSENGQPCGSISYRAVMDEPGHERLELSYCRGQGENRQKFSQTIQLTFTRPHFGGKRWWMICPYSGQRAGKLFLPNGGDLFASRQVWRLDYHSQRIEGRDRPFEALFRLQKRLGCTQGWEQPIYRPKGMWHKTFDRLESRYWQLDALCTAQMCQLSDQISREKMPSNVC